MATKYLNVKNGIEILHENGLTQILTGPGDPSVFGLTANVGSVYMRTDEEGGIYIKFGTVNYEWRTYSYGPPTPSGTSDIFHTCGNMGKYDDEWFPFALDHEKRLKVSVTKESELHAMNGPHHKGILSDNQIPNNITRNYNLTTTSSTLQEQIDDKVIDGGSFI